MRKLVFIFVLFLISIIFAGSWEELAKLKLEINDSLWCPQGYYWEVEKIVSHPLQTHCTITGVILNIVGMGITLNDNNRSDDREKGYYVIAVGSLIWLFGEIYWSSKEVIVLKKDINLSQQSYLKLINNKYTKNKYETSSVTEKLFAISDKKKK